MDIKNTDITMDTKDIIDELVITVTEDNMHLFLLIPQSLKFKVSLIHIMLKLKGFGIAYGIDTEAIDSMLKNNDYNKRKLIVSGILPIEGHDTEFVNQYEFTPFIPAKMLKDHLIFESNITVLPDVKKGDILVKTRPYFTGSPGKDIYGNIIPMYEGKDIPYPIGENVAYDEVTNTFYASIDGKLCLVDGKLTVINFKIIEGDITGTSPIEFNGDLLIKGKVYDNAKITVSGSLIILSSVSDCELTVGDNLVIKEDVTPEENAILKVNNKIIAKSFTKSDIHCGGSMFCDSLVECNIFCEGTLTSSMKNEIRNSTITTYNTLNCYTLGDADSTKVTITAGISADEIEVISSLLNKTSKMKSDIASIEHGINSLNMLEQHADNIDKKQKLLDTLSIYKTKLKETKTEYHKLLERRENLKNVSVNIYSTVHPNVSIKINTTTTLIHTKASSVSYVQFPGIIKACEYMTRTPK